MDPHSDGELWVGTQAFSQRLREGKLMISCIDERFGAVGSEGPGKPPLVE
jgi:hypothetical protein